MQDRRRKKDTSALFGLTWAKRVLVSQKAAARYGKYTPPNISAAQIRDYFVPDFSTGKNHDSYQEAFQRLLSDLKASAPQAK